MNVKKLCVAAGIIALAAVITGVYLIQRNEIASTVQDFVREDVPDMPETSSESSDRWIDVVREWGFSKDGPSSVGCGVRTEVLTLAKGTADETILAVDRQYCPPEYEGQLAFYENRGEYRVTASGVIAYLDPKYMSKDDFDFYKSASSLGGRPLFDYWILDPKQDTKAFIASLTDEPRCMVYENRDKDNIYLSSPDDRTYTLAPDNEEEMNQVDGVTRLCGPYGVGGGISLFKRVDNVLLYLYIGNEMYPVFDPSSFRVVR